MQTPKKIFNFIQGEVSPPRPPDKDKDKDNSFLKVENPATGEVYAEVANSSSADLKWAMEAAGKAQESWAKTSLRERSTILRKLAYRLQENFERLAQEECLDTGKPLSLTRAVDIPRSIENLEFFADSITQFSSEAHPMPGSAINYTLRDPLGIVGCISPWNLPLYLFTWKIAPALAQGNCVIAKPSELTPLTAATLGELSADILPPGVLNILHGEGKRIGEEIVLHPGVKAISFTGGTQTGAHLASRAAPLFKKISLELGGKNPAIIFKDCDLQRTLEETLRGAFSNQGQICLAGSRLFIEKSLYPEFRDEFVKRARALRVGDPLLEGTQMGAVISQNHQRKILSYIELAKQEQGSLLTGGKSVAPEGRCSQGYFVEPTVIEGLSPFSRVNCEEIFGPVVTLTPFESEQEVLQYANSVPYGLAASLWTKDVNRAHALARKLHYGIVWVNCWMLRDLRTPFGGMKASGMGREGGIEALRFFTEPKNICIHYQDS